ncbi:MAG: endonuclease III domain-containing protein [Candidatus Asgardarchaeia archaeon]
MGKESSKAHLEVCRREVLDSYGIFKKLYDSFGPQKWWPGDSKLEMVLGAILTQRTSWKNVEKAINRLKERGLIDLKKLHAIDLEELSHLIRPSGFYREKARRIKSLVSYIMREYGRLEDFLGKDLKELRNELISIKGIGDETADSIILYAAEKPTIVIDGYCLRFYERFYGKRQNRKSLRERLKMELPEDLDAYKEFHALIVKLCKEYCKKKPVCERCPLVRYCNYPSPSKLQTFKGNFEVDDKVFNGGKYEGKELW